VTHNHPPASHFEANIQGKSFTFELGSQNQHVHYVANIRAVEEMLLTEAPQVVSLFFIKEGNARQKVKESLSFLLVVVVVFGAPQAACSGT